MTMMLPAGFGELDWSNWVKGIMSGFISGGASAVVSGFTVGLMDSKDYNFQNGKLWTLIVTLFIVNGVLGMMLYLTKSPLPGVKQITTTVQTTEIKTKPAATVVTTVEETHVEKLEDR
jgi:uncharacterized membrane protein